ncbi:MAG TPA: GtrA family protein [Actinomycetota bacterium]|nr:GtrA family protein [Actinomycetota bacterium]
MLTRARSSGLYVRASRYPIIGQFIKYAMVGALNVAVGLSIFNLLRLVDVHPNIALTVAFTVTSIQSYALNKKWSFKDQGRHGITKGYLLFVSFTLVGFAIQQIGFTVSYKLLLHRYGKLGENLAILSVTPFSVLWNFLAYRRWTFGAARNEARVS